MQTPELERLTRVCYCCHESGHLLAARVLGISCEAEIGELTVSCGNASAATYNYGGGPEDEIFILCGGIAASRHFELGDAGCLQDWHDIRKLTTDESLIERAVCLAEQLIAENAATILKIAYTLHEQGTLGRTDVRKIFSGRMGVQIPESFLSDVAAVKEWDWILKPKMQNAADL